MAFFFSDLIITNTHKQFTFVLFASVRVEPELHTSQDKKVYSDLEQRVQVLEEKVQRLNEALGSVEMLSLGPRHGNGFWSVLSFASWIMVPLICVFMYQYKRSA